MSESATPLTDAAIIIWRGEVAVVDPDYARRLETVMHGLAATLIKSRGHVATNTRSKPRTRREAMRQTRDALAAYDALAGDAKEAP